MSDYKVVDNFLEKEELKDLQLIYENNMDFPWFYSGQVAGDWEEQTEIFYLIHLLYVEDKPNSQYYDLFIKPFLNKKFWNSLIRVKLNNYPNQNKFIEHAPHKDYDFEHKGALFCLNTCDGYTKMHDGKKISSIENRMIFFDPTKEHSSTNTIGHNNRFNLNFNYI